MRGPLLQGSSFFCRETTVLERAVFLSTEIPLNGSLKVLKNALQKKSSSLTAAAWIVDSLYSFFFSEHRFLSSRSHFFKEPVGRRVG